MRRRTEFYILQQWFLFEFGAKVQAFADFG